jgi:hypothetical protein
MKNIAQVPCKVDQGKNGMYHGMRDGTGAKTIWVYTFIIN